ncbi:MAG: DNA primase [Dehalococcoidia bacterium]|nr:DNA primase [Dehalococcoidia bacterium]
MSVTDDIKAKIDIMDVVSPHVSLQKSGRTFKANCPFHTEKTPSFIVNPERQSWHCFGACATGGDIFNFVMRAENLQFGDALRMLAQRAGVELSSAPNREQSNAIHSINGAAAQYFQDTLESDSGRAAREYLDGRKVGQRARDQFKLGLSADRWDGLVQYLRTHGYKKEDAIAAGLIREGDNGQVWDFFRNRLMFPIFDREGSIVGFGARALDDSTPKYINTAQTEAFDKRNTLYALHFANAEIRQTGIAVIVEGYMDAIAAHEHGYKNVVASMGTALTENQVSQLRTLAREFVLALDPDDAGQEATLRSLESSWHVFRDVISRRNTANQSVLNQWTPPVLKIAALPAGLDPDGLIRTEAGRWESIIADAQPLLDFVIPALVQRYDLNIPDSRARIVSEFVRFINRLDDMDQHSYRLKIAEALGVTESDILASLARQRDRRPRSRGRGTNIEEAIEVSSNALRTQDSDPIEEYALSILIQNSNLAEAARSTDPECFHRTDNRELFTALVSYPTIEELRNEVDEVLAEQIRRLESVELPSTGVEHALSQCLRRLELRHIRETQELMLDTEDVRLPPSGEVEAEVKRDSLRIKELETMSLR